MGNDLFVEAIAARVADLVIARLGPVNVPTRLLTMKEAGELAGRSAGAMLRLVYRGELRAVRGGRRVHVEQKELQGWIERCRDTH